MYNPVTHLIGQFKAIRQEDFPDVLRDLPDSSPEEAMQSSESRGSASTDVERGFDISPPVSMMTKTSISSGRSSVTTLLSLKLALLEDQVAFGVDSVYDRKSRLINYAIQEMGFGVYQWQLFFLCGFGWFCDNLWLQGVALTLTPIANEFGVSETNVRYTTLALFAGLMVGAAVWGVAADGSGRRLVFNTTLLLAAVFGVASGGANSWHTVCALYAWVGFGVGGSLPVDGALFLEFLPEENSSFLTGLSVWWPLGSLVGAMLAWVLVTNFSCDPLVELCTQENNMGWRYLLFALGAITFVMWVARFLVFHMFESPKFLLSRGRQTEAVAVIYGVAQRNGKTTWLTEEILNELGGTESAQEITASNTCQVIKDVLSKCYVQRFVPLFPHWKLGLTTCLLWFQWTTIGLGYPLFNAFLPQYIGQAGNLSTYMTYRNYAITNVIGVPGSIIAIYTVRVKCIGRRYTMALATCLTGIFVCLFTISKDAEFQLAMTCLEACVQNVMYGVLYAYTPEVFPAPNRATATGIASTFNRIAGLCAPLLAVFAGEANPTAPIYTSAGLFFAATISMVFLPIETNGRQSL